ncbi:hypothetical protein ACP4OV_012279 [Aristida adscensionis]
MESGRRVPGPGRVQDVEHASSPRATGEHKLLRMRSHSRDQFCHVLTLRAGGHAGWTEAPAPPVPLISGQRTAAVASPAGVLYFMPSWCGHHEVRKYDPGTDAFVDV